MIVEVQQHRLEVGLVHLVQANRVDLATLHDQTVHLGKQLVPRPVTSVVELYLLTG